MAGQMQSFGTEVYWFTGSQVHWSDMAG